MKLDNRFVLSLDALEQVQGGQARGFRAATSPSTFDGGWNGNSTTSQLSADPWGPSQHGIDAGGWGLGNATSAASAGDHWSGDAWGPSATDATSGNDWGGFEE